MSPWNIPEACGDTTIKRHGQKDRLAIGTPTSSLIAEFFLQNLENIQFAHLTEKHKIAGYFRNVDEILLIYDPDHTNIQDITNDFNSLHPHLKFTTELETNNKLNYLDINYPQDPQRLENLNIQ